MNGDDSKIVQCDECDGAGGVCAICGEIPDNCYCPSGDPELHHWTTCTTCDGDGVVEDDEDEEDDEDDEDDEDEE